MLPIDCIALNTGRTLHASLFIIAIQFLGKIKLIDLRLNEAIFEKEDKKFVIIDFNNVIREADEY